MSRFGVSFLVLLGVLAMSACAARAPVVSGDAPPRQRDSLHAFTLAGRFSLRHEGRSYVGRLNWRHHGDRNELLLSSPFGQGIAEIVSDAEGARLTSSDGSVQSAATADELLQSVVAYPLSLGKLLDWLRGRHPDGSKLVLDPLGRPLHLRHEDWRIDYEYDQDDPQALPGRLFVEREGGFALRLRIDEWQHAPSCEDAIR